MSGRDLLAALAVVMIWGLNFVAMKFALRDFTPFQLGAARFLVAALPLIFFVPRPRLPAKWLVSYGLLQGVGQFGLLFLALQAGMTAALASVLMQTQVFFTALLAFFMLRESPGPALRLGLLLAALAMICFAMTFAASGAQGAGAVTAFGFILNLGAAFMWASGNILVRRLQHTGHAYGAVSLVVWSSLVPILPFVALSALFDPPDSTEHWTQAGVTSWLSVIYLGWFATVAAYGLWTRLLKRHPANRVAPFSLGVPVVGLFAGMLVLGESVSAWQWTGIALVIAALACVMFGPGLRSRT